MAVAGSLMVEIGANVARLQRDMSSATSIVSSSAKRMESAFSGVASTMRGLGGILAGGAAISTITSMGSAVVDTGIKFQQLDNAFKSIAGSSAAASTELNFVRETASRLGLDFLSVADSYKGITAAAKGTAMQGAVTRDIFMAVSEAAVVLGMSQQQTSDSLRAISQMMSKGKVSAEELRSQLGEHLPGAFQIAARAMGMTTMELDKFMSDGRLMAEDFLPKFAQALHAQYAGSVGDAANSAQAEFNRFKTATDDLKKELASGLLPVVTNVARELASLIKNAIETKQSLSSMAQQYAIGIHVNFTSNADEIAQQIEFINRGKLNLQKSFSDLFQRFKEGPEKGWGHVFSGATTGASLTIGDRHSQAKSYKVYFDEQPIDMLEAYQDIVKTQKAVRELGEESAKATAGLIPKLDALKQQYQQVWDAVSGGAISSAEATRRFSVLDEQMKSLEKKGRDRGGGGGGGKGAAMSAWRDEQAYLQQYLQAMRTQADAIREAREEIDGALIGGDAGIRSGGIANEMASRRYELYESLKEQGQALRESIDPLERYNAEMKELQALLASGAIGQDTFSQAVARARDAYADAWRESTLMGQTIDVVTRNMESAFSSMITGTKFSWTEMINSMIADLMRLMVQLMVMKPLTGWLTGILTGGGGGGGWDFPYSPFSTGATAMAGGRSGGSITSFAPVINVNVESRGMASGGGADPRSAQALGEQIGRIVSMKIREEIQGQQRDGGILSRRMSLR